MTTLERIDTIIRLEANGKYEQAYKAMQALRDDPATEMCWVISLAHHESALAAKVPPKVWRPKLSWFRKQEEVKL